MFESLELSEGEHREGRLEEVPGDAGHGAPRALLRQQWRLWSSAGEARFQVTCCCHSSR